MRVLVITPQFPPAITGGLGRQVGDLVHHLSGQVEMGVISPTPSDWNVQSFPFLHFGDMLPEIGTTPLFRMNLAILAAGVRSFGSGSWDVIHAHDWAIAPAVSLLANASGIPLIATIHADNAGNLGGSGEDRTRRLEWERMLVNASAVVTGVSEPLARSLTDRYPDADVRAVPNGIVVPDPPQNRSNVQPNEILFVGRLVPYKGVQDLLNAMPTVLESIPEARVRIIGDGFYGDELKQLRETLDLEDVVEFAGWLDGAELQHAFERAAILVAPSHEEAFGLVVAEAMAAGVPVLASDCPAFRDLVEDGKTGRLFGTGDTNDLAVTLLDELRKPASEQQRTTSAALEAIVRTYSWEMIGPKYLELYGAILER